MMLVDLLQRVKRGYAGFRTRPEAGVTSLPSLLDRYNVDLIMDIGANIGQSVQRFRSLGYQGKILSYEPITSVWEQLVKNTASDSNCEALNLAVAGSCGQDDIYVTDAGAVASSLLKMTGNVEQNAPAQKVLGRETVQTTTLEAELAARYASGNAAFLKIDVQGLEATVIESAGDRISQVAGMQIEMSLVENYTGEVLLYQQIPDLLNKDFKVIDIIPGWRNLDTLELYQVDVLLFR